MQNNIITINNASNVTENDYIQSANSIFHFMKKSDYLINALKQKALIPRYCREDMSYLNLNIDNNISFDEIAIPQKCFCDIPLHKITSKFQICDNSIPSSSNMHTDFYGEYALAFSKKWGENKQLQPIQYINTQSFYFHTLRNYILNSLNSDDLSNETVNDTLLRLSFIKPLRGNMKRFNDKFSNVIRKNFHDEQEWRYVLPIEKLNNINKYDKYTLPPMISNPKLLNTQDGLNNFVDQQSDALAEEKYRDLWLDFNYEDIKYIIVPNKQARINCISSIMNLSENQFNNQSNAQMEKLILISKILVLDDIRKDW